MFINYLKVIIRIINRNKLFSLINISGLAIGLACFILIMLWVQDEVSFDKFHQNREIIYRVNMWGNCAYTPPILAEHLKSEIPEIVNATRFNKLDRVVVRYQQNSFFEKGAALADPAFFDIFSFKFIKGNPQTALSNPYNIVLTESLAKKYFGTEEPLNKNVMVDNRVMMVTGIIKDPPQNSHIQFSMISPFLLIQELGREIHHWGDIYTHCYVQLDKYADWKFVNDKISDFVIMKIVENNGADPAQLTRKLSLQPLDNIHLNIDVPADDVVMGDKRYVMIFSIIALSILIIACINFTNLSAALSTKRAKEIGIRKTIGSSQKQLIKQLLAESFVYSWLALFIAIFLIELFLPAFNRLTEKQLHLIGANWLNMVWIGFITCTTGIVSGLYPAFCLSSFQPTKVLKNSFTSGVKGAYLRKALVVLQFTFAVIFMIGVSIVNHQLSFLQNQKLGFNKENIICIPIKDNVAQQFDIFKNELIHYPRIESVTAKDCLPYEFMDRTNDYVWEGRAPNQRVTVNVTSIDYKYIETLGLKLSAGRSFSKHFSSDETQAYILNKEAIKRTQADLNVGDQITVHGRSGQIIGILENAKVHSLKDYKNFPEIYRLITDHNSRVMNSSGVILIKTSAKNYSEEQQVISHINKVWNKFNSDYPFEYHFLDVAYDQLYRTEQKVSVIFTHFSILAIVLSCLGLFGLVSFSVKQKTKEIGIRKTFGAKIPNLIIMLLKNYTKWISLANIIAWPIAWFAMNKWLQNFAYRIEMSWWMFALAGGIALVIALLTVSWQAVRAAVANPVESLRYE